MFLLLLSIGFSTVKVLFKTDKCSSFIKRHTAATAVIVHTCKIRNMITLVNHPTQREVTAKCGVSIATVERVTARILKTKLR